jgi:hypothetical protein
VGLKRLNLCENKGLTTLPAVLWTLAGLEELDLSHCGLRALPAGMEGLAGLKKLNLSYNFELTALPVGLGRLRNLEALTLGCPGMPRDGCPGLAALRDLQTREGLPALLAHLAVQGEPAPAPGVEPEAAATGADESAAAPPLASSSSEGELSEQSDVELDDSAWATLHDLGQREGLPALLAHLAAQGEVALAPGVEPS